MVVAASVILPMQGTHAAVGLSLGVRVFSAIAIFFPTRPPVGDIFSYAWVYHIFDIGIPWIGYVVLRPTLSAAVILGHLPVFWYVLRRPSVAWYR